MYKYDDVYNASLDYFKGDELAATAFASKYALTDGAGNYFELSPDDMHIRLAKEFARIELKYPNPMSEDEIYDLISGFKYVIPQGSPMSAIGNSYQMQSLGNCFVVPSPDDSYGGILKTDQQLAQLMKRRAGVGVDISTLRPRGTPTKNAAKTSDGIGVFMERFSNTCREVAQSGRRGAEMLTLQVNHPDIETFISIKSDKRKVTGANVSVRLTDEFMSAVKSDSDFTLKWPVNSDNPKIITQIASGSLWEKIISMAWKSAEPGIQFVSTIHKMSPAHIYHTLDSAFFDSSSNPCGELNMGNDSCRLMALNLYSFVIDAYTKNARFDFNDLMIKAEKAQRLMDDMIDLEIEIIDRILNKIESDPEPDDVKSVERNMWIEFKRTCSVGRRTGLGITALGDALAALNIRYGSSESIEITELIFKTFSVGAYRSSCIMANERGAFPLFNYDVEKQHPFLNRIWDAAPDVYDLYMKYGRRNIALTTIAPTGTVSLLTQTTSGIEPAFLLKYKRYKKVNPGDINVKIDRVDDMGDSWQSFDVYHHGLKRWMDISGKTDIEDSPYYKSTSNDVDWTAGVRLQAAAQKYICHAISKTVNVPKETSRELIGEIYMTAYEAGCKGITVYRDGCRDGVLVASDDVKVSDFSQSDTSFKEYHAPKRPNELSCEIHQATIKGEAWTILVGLMDGKPYEIFGGLSKYVDIPKKYSIGTIIKNAKKSVNSTYDLKFGESDATVTIKDIVSTFENADYGSLTRMISLSLRHGAPLNFVVEQLTKDKNANIYSFSAIVARILKKYIKDGTKAGGEACPDCGAKPLIYKEGCKSCLSCSFSKCG